jgi:hypothetical protein
MLSFTAEKHNRHATTGREWARVARRGTGKARERRYNN